MKDADLIVLLGARLNWMLHFGKEPRFSKNVQIVQIDIHAEELSNNTNDCIPIQADLRSFCEQMNQYLNVTANFDVDNSSKSDWISFLRQKMNKNKATIQVRAKFLIKLDYPIIRKQYLEHD